MKVKHGHLSRGGAREIRAARFGRRRVGESHPPLLHGDVDRLADPEAVRGEPTARHAQVRHVSLFHRRAARNEAHGHREDVGRSPRPRLARAVCARRGALRHAHATTTRTSEHGKLLKKGGATGEHLREPPNVMNQERSFGTSSGQKYASTPYGRSAVRRSFSRKRSSSHVSSRYFVTDCWFSNARISSSWM